MELWQLEQEQARREGETFRRFHRLRKAGYVIDWGTGDVEDAIFLNHLGSGPSLILYSCGMLVSLNFNEPLVVKNDEPDRIMNLEKSDVLIFDRWLRSVKRPTWWQCGRPDREKYIYAPGCFILLILASLGVGKLFEAISHSMAF